MKSGCLSGTSLKAFIRVSTFPVTRHSPSLAMSKVGGASKGDQNRLRTLSSRSV